jgi:hypothetical protein
MHILHTGVLEPRQRISDKPVTIWGGGSWWLPKGVAACYHCVSVCVLITRFQAMCPAVVPDCHRIILVRSCCLCFRIHDFSVSSDATNHGLRINVHGFLSPKGTFHFCSCFLCLVSLCVSPLFLSFFVSTFSGLFPFLVSLFIPSFIYFKKHGLIICWVIVCHWSLLRKQRPGNAIISQYHWTGSSEGNAVDLFSECARCGPGHGLSWLRFFLIFPRPSRKMPG